MDVPYVKSKAKREAINHDALIAAFTKSTKTYDREKDPVIITG